MIMAKGKSVRHFINHWDQSLLQFRSTRMVGLNIGSRGVTLVQLESSGGSFWLTRFAFRELAEGMVVDGAILDWQGLLSELRDLVRESGLSGQPVMLSVSGPSVRVKRLKISGVRSRDLDEHLLWEGHRYISHPLDEVCFDHQVLRVNGEEELDILLVFAKRDLVEDHQILATNAGLKPVGCDVDGLALANMASLAGFNSYPSYLNVNLGSGGGTIVALEKGMPLFVREVPWDDALNEERTSIEGTRKGVGQATAEPVDRVGAYRAQPDIPNMAREIRRNLNDMKELGSVPKVEQILISGDGATQGLCQKLAGELSMSVSLLNPFHGIGIRDPHINQHHLQRFGPLAGVAVGLAARSDCYT